MTLIVTQNGTIYNISDFKFITIENVKQNEEDKFGIVIDQTYVIGYYDTEEQAIKTITWIANKIGANFNSNISIVIPTVEEIENFNENATDDTPTPMPFPVMNFENGEEKKDNINDDTTNV